MYSFPRSIKTIIFTTIFVSLGAALIDTLLYKFDRLQGLQFFLSLSELVWKALFLWQPVTYLFTIQSSGGVNLSFFFSLIIPMLFVWMFGSPIAERYGDKSASKLYLFSGMIVGLLALLLSSGGPYYSPISGPEASIFAFFTVWTMMHPEGEILLYFLFPIQAKWLFAIGFAIFFLSAAATGSIDTLVLILGGTIAGYLYGAYFKGLSFPFSFLHPLDSWLRRKKQGKAEIIPFTHPKKEESDDEFLDRVLEKISKKGKSSLTRKEQERLDQISKKR